MGLDVRKSTILAFLLKLQWKVFLTFLNDPNLSLIEYIQKKNQGNYKHKKKPKGFENKTKLEKLYPFPLNIKNNVHMRKNEIALVDFPGELFQLISSKGDNIYEKTKSYVRKFNRYNTVFFFEEGKDIPAFRRELHKKRAAESRKNKQPYTEKELDTIFENGGEFKIDRLMVSPNYKSRVTDYFRAFVATKDFGHIFVFHSDGINNTVNTAKYSERKVFHGVELNFAPIEAIYEAENKCGYMARVLNHVGTDVFCGDGDFLVISLLNKLNVQIFSSAVKTVFQSPYVPGWKNSDTSIYSDTALVAYHFMFIGGIDYSLLTEFNGVGKIPKHLNCSSIGLQKSQFETIHELEAILMGETSCFSQLYETWDPLDLVSGRNEDKCTLSNNYIFKFMYSSRNLLCNLSTTYERRLDYGLQYMSIIWSAVTYYTILIMLDMEGNYKQGFRDSCFSILMSLYSELSPKTKAKYVVERIKGKGTSVKGVHTIWKELYPAPKQQWVLHDTFLVTNDPKNGPNAGKKLGHVYVCTQCDKFPGLLFPDGRPKHQTSFSGIPGPPGWFRKPKQLVETWEKCAEPPEDEYIGGFNPQILHKRRPLKQETVRDWSFANKIGSDLHKQTEDFIDQNMNDDTDLIFVDNKWPVNSDFDLVTRNFKKFREYMKKNNLLFVSTELSMANLVEDRFITGTTDVILIDKATPQKLKQFISTVIFDGSDSFCTTGTRKTEPIVRIILGDWKFMPPFPDDHPHIVNQHKKLHYCAQGYCYQLLADAYFFGYFISQSIIIVLPRRDGKTTQVTIVDRDPHNNFTREFFNPKYFEVYDINKQYTKQIEENQIEFLTKGKFKYNTMNIPVKLKNLIWQWRHIYDGIKCKTFFLE